MRLIMDALSPSHPARRVVFMKAAQVGATEAGNNWIGYVIHHAPGPMLAVQPTVELAKRNSRQRIDPLIADSPVLSERVGPAPIARFQQQYALERLPGRRSGYDRVQLRLGLRSMPARYVFLDEVDAYPASADVEGDPVTLAEARSQTFSHRRKVLLISTPTIKGMSRIEREYEASEQQRYFVPCPHCGHEQVLKFERLRWEKGKPETARYYCEACEKPIGERHKTAMLKGGEWRATAETNDPTTTGFHISALYSPAGWKSWADIARDKEQASGFDDAQRAFKNTVLGETWVETGDAPDWWRLADRRESWPAGTVPEKGLFLTAGADVQKDRIEVDVWAWGRGLESWLIDHAAIEGGPGSRECWSELTNLLGRTWLHESATPMTIMRLAIDTGYETSAVYGFARQSGFGQVSPIKGVDGFNKATPVTGPTFVDVSASGRRLRRGARLWTVAVSTFKAEMYRFLRLAQPTPEELSQGAQYSPGSIHLLKWADDEWLKQLTAEQLVTVRDRRGFARLEWRKMRERNEALDCRVYARAAAWIVGADRWSEARWAEMEMRSTQTPSCHERRQEKRRRVDRPLHERRRRSGWIGDKKGWLDDR